MTEIKRAFLDDRSRLEKLYILWARNLWVENVIFYNLTINLAVFFTDKNFRNILEESELNTWSESFLTLLGSIDFIECVHGSFILEKENLKLYCILGFRLHFDTVSFLRVKLEKLLISKYETNFKISFLSKFKDVVNSLLFLSKNFDKIRKYNYAFAAVYSSFCFHVHTILLSPIIHEELGCIESTVFSIFGECYWRSSPCQKYKLPPGKFYNIGSISKYLQKEKFGCVVYYLLFYFHTKTSIFYQNILYKKKKEWPDDIQKILEKYIIVNIISILTEVQIIFDFINIMDLFFIFKINRKKVISLLILLIKNKNLARTLNLK